MELPCVLAAIHTSNSSPELILCLTPSLPNNHKSGNKKSFVLSLGNLELPGLTDLGLTESDIYTSKLTEPDQATGQERYCDPLFEVTHY